jgi:hypothetical protein
MMSSYAHGYETMQYTYIYAYICTLTSILTSEPQKQGYSKPFEPSYSTNLVDYSYRYVSCMCKQSVNPHTHTYTHIHTHIHRTMCAHICVHIY